MYLVSRQALEGVTPPGIPYSGFIGGIWAGIAISGLVLLGRLIARIRGPGRVYWDDVFVIMAFILVLATGAVWQWRAEDMYYVLNVQAGLEQFDQVAFFPRMRRWLRVSLIAEMFFYTGLLLIKLSFLLFFKRLGKNIDFFRWVWWPVLFVTLCCYFVSVGDVDYKCLAGPVEEILQKCNTESSIHFAVSTLQANCALDVLSDFLIILLPTILLWRTQIPWKRKLAIIGLFSLSIVTMVIAIVRVATIGITRRPDGNLDNTYLWLWSAIEPPVAIVVCCLSAFPQLFTQSPRNQKPVFTPSESRLRMMSRIRSRKNRTKDTFTELNPISQSTFFDQTRIDTEAEATVISRGSLGSQRPMLALNHHRPVAHAYRGTHENRPTDSDGRVMQQIEFAVTK